MRDVHVPSDGQVKAELFFGLESPDGQIIGKADFMDFLVGDITPTFKGFNVTFGLGFWEGKPEDCATVTILAEDGVNLRHTIRMIAERFKTRFNQQAVAYAFSETKFTLNCWPFGPVASYHKEGLGY